KDNARSRAMFLRGTGILRAGKVDADINPMAWLMLYLQVGNSNGKCRLFQVLLRQKMRLIFGFPVHAENPPSTAVIHELKTVDSPGKGLFALGVAGFVGAPDVGYLVPSLKSVGDGILVETVSGKGILGAHGVLLRGEDPGRDGPLVVASRGNQAGAGIVQ